jgi:hypothetical protein
MANECPFKNGELVVIDSYLRREVWVTRIYPIHIEYWGTGIIPKIRAATTEEKRLWYENGEHEYILVPWDEYDSFTCYF